MMPVERTTDDPYLSFDPIDVIQLSLLANSDHLYDAAIEPVSWIITNGKVPEAIEALDYVHQLGLFENLLKRLNCWDALDETDRKTIEVINRLREGIATSLSLYASQVGEVLQSIGVQHAFLKGLVSSELYYCAPHERPYKDIDILVRRDSVPKAFSAFAALGFEPGRLNHVNNEVELLDGCTPEPSADHYELPVMWREVPIDNVEDFEIIEKLINEKKVRGYFINKSQIMLRIPVEIHYDAEIFRDHNWKPHSIPLRHGGAIQALIPEQHFAFCLYKGYIDICLGGKRYGSKLISDCWRQLRQSPEGVDHAIEACVENRLQGPAFYLFHHASHLLKIPIASDLLSRIEPDGKHWARGQYNFGDFLPRVFRNPKLLSGRLRSFT